MGPVHRLARRIWNEGRLPPGQSAKADFLKFQRQVSTSRTGRPGWVIRFPLASSSSPFPNLPRCPIFPPIAASESRIATSHT